MRPARLTSSALPAASARPVVPARPAVVLVAHGSRDPRAAVATESLARAVRRARPEWVVRASYLDHDGPRPLDVLASLSGPRAVLVPLLLTAAYHGRVDLPAVVREAAELPIEVSASDVLGPISPLLLAALCRRLPQSKLPSPLELVSPGGLELVSPGGPASPLPATPPCPIEPVVPGGHMSPRGPAVPWDGVVLASAGTRNVAARATVAEAAEALGRRLGVPAAVSYASGDGPRPGEAVAALRAAGARRVVMAAYFLAPGFLYDLAAQSAVEAGAVAVAEPLGDAPELVRLVAARAEAALSGPLTAAA